MDAIRYFFLFCSNYFNGASKYFLNLQEDNAYYFATMFCFNYLALFMTFLWFFFVVARKIHLRDEIKKVDADPYSMAKTPPSRRHLAQKKSCKSIEEDPAQSPESVSQSDHFKVERMRQLKLCKVMILLLGTYLMLRLPYAIYLLFRIHNHDEDNIFWVLHYSFGSLTLLDTAIRPVIYIFLSKSFDPKEVFKKVFSVLICPIFKKFPK